MIQQSSFKPMRWLGNAHLQTLLPTLARQNQQVSYLSQRIDTEDNDFIDLAWTSLPVGTETDPILILFHGLEGSVHSPYIKGMFQMARSKGWIAVLMHFRGCSGEPNRQVRRYHSGETGDAGFLIRTLRKRFPSAPLFAVGFSLGGNMLLKYLSEQKGQECLKAAVAVSVPFELNACAARLESGFSQMYQRHLMISLKNSIKTKMARLDHSSFLRLSSREIDQLRTFRQFDEHVTAPLHDFKGADDYYHRCSSRQFLREISCKTLIIQAKDDPFLSQTAIPEPEELSPYVTLELSEKGGHVGFVSGGTLCRPRYWLEERIPNFLQEQLANQTA